MTALNNYATAQHPTTDTYSWVNTGYKTAPDLTNAPGQYSATTLRSLDNNSLNIFGNTQQIQKLKSFLNLKENWDSYSAAPAIEHCVQSAIDFIKRFDEKYQEVYFVAPGPNGEVLVELKNSERSVEVIFDENIIEYIKYEGNDATEDIYNGMDDIDSQLISWLRNA